MSQTKDRPSIEEMVALRIASIENNSMVLQNEVTLRQILNQPGVAESEVAIVSIAGSYRGGKSFLQNLFKMQAKNGGSRLPSDGFISGFDFYSSIDAVTSGVLMWPEPFFITKDDGNRVAVFFMDTQGFFDSNSIMIEDAKVFSFSTLISSLQIYNVEKMVRQPDLEYLRIFTEFARLATTTRRHEESQAPFQHLKFVLRDWQNPDEYAYGEEGGKAYMNEKMFVGGKQPESVQELRMNIKMCFEKMSCFLLQHPGGTVTTSKPGSRIALSDVDKGFLSNVETLLLSMVSPKSIAPKHISGVPVKGREVFDLMKLYINSLNEIESGEEAGAQAMYAAVVGFHNAKIVEESLAKYTDVMSDYCRPPVAPEAPAEIEVIHRNQRQIALEMFDAARKMGDGAVVAKFKEDLCSSMDESYNRFADIMRREEEKQRLIERADEIAREFAESYQLLEQEREAERERFNSAIHEMNEKQKIESQEQQKKMDEELRRLKSENERKDRETEEKIKRMEEESEKRNKEMEDAIREANESRRQGKMDTALSIVSLIASIAAAVAGPAAGLAAGTATRATAAIGTTVGAKMVETAAQAAIRGRQQAARARSIDK